MEYLTSCSIEHLPDVILIDYNMPLANGDELLEWIGARAWLSCIKKFVWSTADAPEFRKRCLGKGALVYFKKPSTDPELQNVILEIKGYCAAV